MWYNLQVLVINKILIIVITLKLKQGIVKNINAIYFDKYFIRIEWRDFSRNQYKYNSDCSIN